MVNPVENASVSRGAPVRCLLVGFGGRSRKRHLPALLDSGGVTVVGVCDVDPGVAGLAPPGVPFFADVATAVAATRPDIAVVATPHDTHLAITELLVRAGVAVLKEKPFALNLAEARRIAELVEVEGGFLRLAVQRQFNPTFTTARERLDLLGPLRHFEAVYHLNTPPYGDTWRGDPSQAGGGALLDMGYHTLDLIVSYFGLPRSVSAVEVLGRTGDGSLVVEESVAAILEYDSGVVGRVFLSRCEPRKHEGLTVIGAGGSISVGPDHFRRHDSAGVVVEEIPEVSADSNKAVVDGFLATLGDRETAKAECERGLRVMALTEALYSSMRTGSVVAVSVEDPELLGIA